MKFVDRLKGALVAILLLVICFPIAVVLTIATSPLWSWVESRFKVEAYGHSGPAEWCYLATYVGLVTSVVVIWSTVRAKRVGQREK